MENKGNCIQTIIFVDLCYTWRGKWNSKNKAKSRKIGSPFFPIYFDGWISLTLSQNANQAHILGHLWNNIYIEKLRQINRYLKEINIENKVVSSPQLYGHVATYTFEACNLVRKCLAKTSRGKYFYEKSYLAEPIQKNLCGGVLFNYIVWIKPPPWRFSCQKGLTWALFF